MTCRIAPAVLALVVLWPAGAAAQPADSALPPMPPAATHDPPVEFDLEGAPSIGPDDAPVTIVEFVDFQCPFCVRTQPLLRTLLEHNPETVRLVIMAFPVISHEHAFHAAEAASVAQSQGKFLAMHDALLEHSSELDPVKIRELAAGVGLDMEAYDAAITNRTHRDAIAAQGYRGRRAGVTGTPTLFVNGYRVGARRELPAMQELIDDLAAGRTPRQLPPPPPPMDALDTIRGRDPFRGNPQAPVTLVEFSDFHCPYCLQTQPLIRQLMALYPGQLKVVYKQFPLRRSRGDSLLAARASLAAHAQGKFWEMHDKLFAAGPDIDGAAVEQLAAGLGLDAEKFRADMASPDVLRVVQEDMAMGQRADVSATPTLFVNNSKVTRRDLRLIRAMIESELRERGLPLPPRR
jgi:protein-disulfide isomerase